MLNIPANTRGTADHGWLQSRFTFSFADYYDPKRMGFGALRVINDDSIERGMGFGMHPHRDMEIISIPLAGNLRHQDSEGNKAIIRKGEVQIMSAGTGILHSEFATEEEDVQLLQIWVMPKKYGVKPRYDQKVYDLKDNELTLVVSPDGKGTAIGINQDAYFSLGKFSKGKALNYDVKQPGNGVFVFALKGTLTVNGQTLNTRDGVGISDTEKLSFTFGEDTDVLLMEVPMLGMHA